MKKIAHLSDIQIRFGSRHDEYRMVFERTYRDLETQKPDRILVTGDLNHNKINMSPISIDLAAEFLISLSKIAPVDVIPGNHDLNLQQLNQGDSIEPLVKLMDNGFVVKKENVDSLDFSYKKGERNGVFYYPETGLFTITPDLIYGNYSCIDNGVITLSPRDKKDGVKYIALFHGTVYGARNDNGYENKDIMLTRLSTFDNFDIIALGDIHEYQTFREDESAAYAGSLIQQNFGESIEKGYLIWNLEDNTHERRFVMNDYGFCTLNISRGESIEDRIDDIKFSNNKKKTKIYIEYEDYEENYSVERENQIKKLIKEKYGCESVELSMKEIHKDKSLTISEEEADVIIQKNIGELLRDYLVEKDDQHDMDPQLLEDIIALGIAIDKTLEIKPDTFTKARWSLMKMEISNMFSFPVEPIVINFDRLKGITGIFGENFSGKSNIIKTLVWGLYQTVLGTSDTSKLVNVYTENPTGYVKIFIEMGGEYYRISRSVTRKLKRDKSFENSYNVEYTVYTETVDEDGKIKKSWEKEKSDKKTLGKTEVKQMIAESIGECDDFTKVTLQVQGGKDDYINQSQQPKNDLIKRYVGLQNFSLRYDYGNETFKEIKKKQKELGNFNDLSLKATDQQEAIKQQKANLSTLHEEKRLANTIVDDLQANLMDLTSKLERIELVEENNPKVVEEKLSNLREEFTQSKKKQIDISEWLSTNFLKELPHKIAETPEQIQNSIDKKSVKFKKEKEEYIRIKSWLDVNFKKTEIDAVQFETQIEENNKTLLELKNKLPLYKGNACPTCGHVHQEAAPLKEESCKADIAAVEAKILKLRSQVKESKEIVQFNLQIDNEKVKLAVLENSIRSIKKEVEDETATLATLNGMADLIAHNKKVEKTTKEAEEVRTKLDEIKVSGEKYKNMIEKIKENHVKMEANKKIKEKTEEAQELIKRRKLDIYNLDQQINHISGDIRILEKELTTMNDKLVFIRDSEREYKKYSIYLQAVHRDGIPAQIIRKKLPMINNKIRSLTRGVVDFKIEIDVMTNGDIIEYFYYSDDKSDSFPLSSASGAQKFIASLAIKDALHHISNMTKPSLCIIDEGFGALDANLRAKTASDVFAYLKNKYKNILVISHEDSIKDGVDNQIVVSKTQVGIPAANVAKYKESWVTQVDIKNR